SNGKMEFNAVIENEQYQLGYVKAGYNIIHQTPLLSSGGDLTLISNSSILYQGADLEANKSLFNAAEGGFLFAQAMQNIEYYNLSTRYWLRKSRIHTVHEEKINKVAEFSANEDINLLSRDDSTYQGSNITAGRDVTLTSTKGKVK